VPAESSRSRGLRGILREGVGGGEREHAGLHADEHSEPGPGPPGGAGAPPGASLTADRLPRSTASQARD